MRRQTIFFALAGLTSLAAATLVYSALRKREALVQQAMLASVDVVVAARALPIGTKLSPQMVKIARWPRDILPPAVFFDQKSVLGGVVKDSLVLNEPIVGSKLFLGDKNAGVMPLLIPPGMRAISVSVDEVSDVAGFVSPHARVDVLVAVSGADAGQKPFSKIVVQDVEVLAVAQEIEGKKDEPQVVKVVTLLATPEQAERLTLAGREGTLRLAMRGYDDRKIVDTGGISVTDLFQGAGRQALPVAGNQSTKVQLGPPAGKQPRPFEIQVIRNGKDIQSLAFDGTALEARRVPATGSAPRAATPSPASKDRAQADSARFADGAALRAVPTAQSTSMSAQPSATSPVQEPHAANLATAKSVELCAVVNPGAAR